MPSEASPVDDLRAYLRQLRPEMQAKLIREVERGSLRGGQFPGSEMVLEALRPSMRRARTPRTSNPARLFFQPLEPFLIDGMTGSAMPGRLGRAFLEPIWTWIERDLVPEAARAYSARAAAALLDGDHARAEKLAYDLQSAVVVALTNALDAAAADARFRRRMAAQVGLPHALQDLQTLHRALYYRDALARVAARLPNTISNLTDQQLDNVSGLVTRTMESQRELLLPTLILVMSRLSAPWQLIRLPIRVAETDLSGRVAQTPLALAGTLVIGDIRHSIDNIRSAFRRGRIAEATAACKPLHDMIRAVRTELDLSDESKWAREFAGLRAQISDLLTVEIERTPGLMRRLLRPRPARDIEPGSVLDAMDVEEAEVRIELAAACRNYAGELAVNEAGPRIFSDLRTQFEIGSATLIESLRRAGSGDRAFRQSQVDAATRFAERLFDRGYATVFAKSAGLAASEQALAQA